MRDLLLSCYLTATELLFSCYLIATFELPLPTDKPLEITQTLLIAVPLKNRGVLGMLAALKTQLFCYTPYAPCRRTQRIDFNRVFEK